MITTHVHKKLTWIDIQNPSAEDIATIIKDYAIHPHWANDLLTPTERAKTDVNEHAFYAVLHYPDHPSMRHDAPDIEVDYIITDHALITAHYSPIDVFMEFEKQFDVDTALDRLHVTTGADLFLELNNRLYRGLREELEPFKKEIRKIEGEIFQGHEFHMVHEISKLHRRLLDFKQATRSHHIILKSFELQAARLFPGTSINQDAVMREYFRVENALENCHELLRELRSTNDSLLTAKNNDVTKRLTLMAFVTFPLTLVATVLLASNSPAIFHGQHGFWMIVGILVAMFLVMHVYFTYKKWI